jgi:uncharacterized protein YpmS
LSRNTFSFIFWRNFKKISQFSVPLQKVVEFEYSPSNRTNSNVTLNVINCSCGIISNPETGSLWFPSSFSYIQRLTLTTHRHESLW